MLESIEKRPSRWFAVELAVAFMVAGALTIGAIELLRMRSTEIAWISLANWQYIFVGVTALIVVISIFRKIRSRLIWEIVFFALMFVGVWYLALVALPFGWGIGIASVITLGALFIRNGFFHNLFVVFGCIGVAINFAGWLSPDVLLVGLVAMTLYDTLAGPPGGPVEELASQFVQKGVIPGLVLIPRVSELFRSVQELVRRNGALLGAGDLILPLMLVARAAMSSALSAGAVLVGLLIGTVVLGRKSSHPRAVLVPLAVGAAIPFFVLRLLGAV